MTTPTPHSVPRFMRFANVMTRNLLRIGIPLNGPRKAPMYLLTVPGRTSGLARTTPIATIEQDGIRYLMAPYGVVDWVRNLRASGEGTLTRARHSERFHAHELEPEAGASVIRRFVATGNPIARLFAIAPDAPDRDYLALARQHPVFRVEPVTVSS